MKEKAKQIFLVLKSQNESLSESFNAYVKQLSEDLEIDELTAVTLVTDELVNRYQKKLILKGLFSNSTLENFDKKI